MSAIKISIPSDCMKDVIRFDKIIHKDIHIKFHKIENEIFQNTEYIILQLLMTKVNNIADCISYKNDLTKSQSSMSVMESIDTFGNEKV